MRIPAQMFLTRIKYAQMCEDIPSTSFLFPTEEEYNFKMEECLDIFVTDICNLDLLSEAGRVWRMTLEQGLISEEDLRTLEITEGYVVEFAPHEIEDDPRLEDWQGTWYAKSSIRLMC